MDLSRLHFLSAPRGAGKTTFCKRLVSLARAQGWEVAGLLSPAVFEGGKKIGILARDLRTDETRPLAVAASDTLPAPAAFCLPLGSWLFDPAVFDWGNRVLAASLPCDLLILDELGPLELTQGQGWHTALDLLHRDAAYRLGLAVIRPELLTIAQSLFPDAQTLDLAPAGNGQQAEQWFGRVQGRGR